jgi:hypothetical protein
MGVALDLGSMFLRRLDDLLYVTLQGTSKLLRRAPEERGQVAGFRSLSIESTQITHP